VALAAVCAALTRADRAALHDRQQELLTRLRDGLARVPGVVPVSVFGDRRPRVGIVSLAVPAHDPAVIADRLAGEYGIGVRAGQFCAHPLTRRLTGSTVATGCGSAGLLRISIGLGTSEAEVDRVIGALGELTSRSARFTPDIRG
jgi:selenocysteine lyase/cysteine desulfurase